MEGKSSAINNLGGVYYDQGDYDKSFQMYTKSADLFEKIGDWQGYASSVINLGHILEHQEKYQEAMNKV